MKTTSEPRLSVTNIASQVYCPRKAYFSIHNIQTEKMNMGSAIGKYEHEVRRKIDVVLRDEYKHHMTIDNDAIPDDTVLLDTVLHALDAAREMARATHPQCLDAINQAIKDRIETNLLNEEQKRREEYSRLISSNMDRNDILDAIFPYRTEYRLESHPLGIIGRVDQLWRHYDVLEPRDLKTCGPEIRCFYEESYWVQCGLYGILTEEQEGKHVERVGIYYTHDRKLKYRPMDNDLRNICLAALTDSRDIALLGHPPINGKIHSKCFFCPFESICHGNLIPERKTVITAKKMSAERSIPEENVFFEFHKSLYNILVHNNKLSRDNVLRSIKKHRHIILAENSETAEDKIRAKRLIKALIHTLPHRLGNGNGPSIEMYFNGPSVDFRSENRWFIVRTQEGNVIPWIYAGIHTRYKEQHQIADKCLEAQSISGLPCHMALCMDDKGDSHSFKFENDEKMRYSAQITSNNLENKYNTDLEKKQEPNILDSTANHEPSTKSCVVPPYIGFIIQTQKLLLTIGEKQRKIFAHVDENHTKLFNEGDFLIAEKPSGENEIQIFLRVRKSTSFERKARTISKAIEEFETTLDLEPLAQRKGNQSTGAVCTDNYNGYKIRRCTPDEISAFLHLPSLGWPIGTLADESVPVLAYLPFEPLDSIYRSFFVVGAKGKGKTSFVRELALILTGYQATPLLRPAIVIIDGEPKPPEDRNADEGASEFNDSKLTRSYKLLVEQLGGSHILEHPKIREIRFHENCSGIKYSYGEINNADIPLLLPKLTENGAEAIDSILYDMERRKDLEINNLQNVFMFIREEVRNNGIINKRTAQALNSRLHSPSIKILEYHSADAINIYDLIKPGTISVLNVTELNERQRKIVTMYLLLAFEKIAEKRGPLNLLLVMDEAEKLFPRKRAGQTNVTTTQRVAERVGGIAHRGRRKRFGMVICTQHPKDVSSEIIDNCDIKLTFCLTGQSSWVKEYLGKEYTEKVRRLDTGCCYLDICKVAPDIFPVAVRLFET